MAPPISTLPDCFEGEALEGVRLPAAHGFRTGLNDVELAILTILGPLDVHRAAVVLIDDDGLLSQRHHLFIRDAAAAAPGSEVSTIFT